VRGLALGYRLPMEISPTAAKTAASLVRVSRKLSRACSALDFEDPVTHVYNPLEYARASHEVFLKRFGGAFADSQDGGEPRAILLGMNPGPWGMAQTGIPFGDVTQCTDWLGIQEPVKKPKHEHPKRLVTGFDCTRNEVSGTRVYEFAAQEFATPEAFFRRFYIVNYCPLSFMEEGGKNRTPDKLPAEERAPLFEACDHALKRTVELLRPSMVVGVGAFAEACARRVLGPSQVRLDLTFGRVLHPSPASPIANRGWAKAARKDLAGLGLL
jgi:single-strand selective monofunctional uracil DNA glycosylase